MTEDEEQSGPPRISFGRLLAVGTKAYGINLLLLIGLHPLVPIAILVPMATGFATGWQIEATKMQGAAIGLIMGLWMALVCSIGVAAAVIASLLYPGGLEAGAELGIAAIVGGLTLHLTTFGGIGAILGGHFARKERLTQAASALKAAPSMNSRGPATVVSLASPRGASWLHMAPLHGALVAGATAVFALVCLQGQQTHLTQPPPGPVAAATQADALLPVLLALVLIVGTARVPGALLALLGQPPVIGEIVGGLLLGPSFFGRVAPDVSALVFPGHTAPFLNVIAQLGVILYMFLVGLDLDTRALRQSGRAMFTIAHAGIAGPFALGSMLALVLYPRYGGTAAPFPSFALFAGVAVSVTAFPVLARILTDVGVSRSPLGELTLGCAAWPWRRR